MPDGQNYSIKIKHAEFVRYSSMISLKKTKVHGRDSQFNNFIFIQKSHIDRQG